MGFFTLQEIEDIIEDYLDSSLDLRDGLCYDPDSDDKNCSNPEINYDCRRCIIKRLKERYS